MGELPLQIWQIKSQITLKKMKDWCSFITKIVVIYVPKFNQLLIRVFFFAEYKSFDFCFQSL